MTLADLRSDLVEDRGLQGSAFCRALTDQADNWLVDLHREHVGDLSGVALAAVGGYGRSELCPHSDLDVLLVHGRPDAEISEIASRLWYPIWDEGVKLGHSVRTIDEAVELAKSDLDTATSLLTVRFLAGDRALVDKLANAAAKAWHRNAKHWMPRLEESVRDRHAQAGEIAFTLEPDLKEGRGGLRDVHALQWAAAADGSGRYEPDELAAPYETILRARVELHRNTGRRGGDTLLLEQQDAVAAGLGHDDADDLMAEVAEAARRIAWHSDEVWTRMADSRRRRNPLKRRSATTVAPGVTVADRLVHVDDATEITPDVVLDLAAAAIEYEARFDPDTIAKLEAATITIPDPWPDGLRDKFVDVLLRGHAAIPIIETIDQVGLFVPFIPEWAPNRSRPQRNAFHRFTVDRHLWEAAAEASAFVDEVDRPDLLVMGALLHDVGKGYPGDHTDVGIELIPTLASRMGFPPEDVAVLVDLCRHHLLLPDVATRRDLEDDDTIRSVADAVGSIEVLRLLRALTEADSIATGPAAWSRWKAGLVHDLTNRTTYVLEGGDARELPRTFPTDEHRQAMRRGTRMIHGEGHALTVMAIDRPGVFSRVAGALTLNGLEVIEAAAHSEFGIALAMFRVESRFDDRPIDWEVVGRSVEECLQGRVAIAARVQELVRTYSGRRTASKSARPIVEPNITVDNESSSSATVVEVAAPTGTGLLYYVTRALSQMDLDIASAKIVTLGDSVVDSFYLRNRDGEKFHDEAFLVELGKALDHAIRLANLSRDGSDG
ncbi:MAG: [protein-PII] uridylyltransferase [Actinomycetota bacterium]